MSLNTTPRTWVSGEVVTAAEMNAEVRDALTGIQAAFSTYTPVLTNMTNVNGTLEGRFTRFGKYAEVWFQFTLGASSTISAGAAFSLPVTALKFNWAFTRATYWDSSANAWFPIWAIAISTTTVALRTAPSVAGNALQQFTATAPVAFGAGDVITAEGTYEAA